MLFFFVDQTTLTDPIQILMLSNRVSPCSIPLRDATNVSPSPSTDPRRRHFRDFSPTSRCGYISEKKIHSPLLPSPFLCPFPPPLHNIIWNCSLPSVGLHTAVPRFQAPPPPNLSIISSPVPPPPFAFFFVS